MMGLGGSPRDRNMQQPGHRLGIWKACVADTVPEPQRHVPDRADLNNPHDLRRSVEQDLVWHLAADDIRRHPRQDEALHLVRLGLHEPALGGHRDAFLGGMHAAGKGMASIRQGDLLEPQRDHHVQHLHQRCVARLNHARAMG